MDRCCYICCFRNTSDCGFRYVFRLGKWMIIRGVSQSQPQFRNTQPYISILYSAK